MAMNLSYLKVICPFCNVKLQVDDQIDYCLLCKTCKKYAYHKDERMILFSNEMANILFAFRDKNRILMEIRYHQMIDNKIIDNKIIHVSEKDMMKYIHLILEGKLKKVLMLQ